MSKQKSEPQAEPKDEYIVLAIQRWNWLFSFGLDSVQYYEPGTLCDHRHLDIHGRFLRPRRLAGPRVELCFVASDRHKETDPPPLLPRASIGGLWSDPRRNRHLGNLSMPNDVLPSVLAVLAAERVRYVVMVGIERSPGRIDVREYDLIMDEEDLPAEDATPDGDMAELRAEEGRRLKARS